MTLDEVKLAVNLPTTASDFDDLLTRLIAEAREAVEHDTGMVLCSSTWSWKLDLWPCDHVVCPVRPVQSVTSITYVDAGGATQTWDASNYTLDVYRVQPVILRAFVSGVQATFPVARTQQNAITVTVEAGHPTLAAIPQLAKQAVKVHVRRSYEHREGDQEYDRAYESLVRRLMRSSYP